MTAQQTKDLEKIKTILGKIKSKGKSVGFTIELRDGNFDISCGFNYPDSIATKVLAIQDKIKTRLNCSAEVCGGTVESTTYVNGGKSDRQWMKKPVSFIRRW